MNDLLETTLKLMGGAAGVIAVVVALVHYFSKKVVDRAFAHLERISAERLALQVEVSKQIASTQTSIYPSLAELVYRAKVGAGKARHARLNINAIKLSPQDIIISQSFHLISNQFHIMEKLQFLCQNSRQHGTFAALA